MVTSSRPRPILWGMAIAAIAVFTFASPASAHDALDGSEPETGAVVEVAPDQITLNFTADLMAGGAAAEVFEGTDTVASSGTGTEKNWAEGDVIVDGASMIVPLASDMPAGTYSVNWRAVSSDGHPITTSSAAIVTFTVTTGVVAEPTEQATAEPSVEPTVEESLDATVQPTTAPTSSDSADGSGGVPIWVFFGGAIVIAGVAVLGVKTLRKPRA